MVSRLAIARWALKTEETKGVGVFEEMKFLSTGLPSGSDCS